MNSDEPMNDPRPDMDEWEAQINALLDGELDDRAAEALKSAAEADQTLARAIVEAYQLQRVMATIPLERAPDSLREKLRRIPAEQESLQRAAARPPRQRSGWFGAFEPRWVMALAALPLVVALGVHFSGPRQPSAAELAQARHDLGVALAYLEKASRATEREIEHSIDTGMAAPVTERTVKTLTDQLNLNEEQGT